MADETYRKFHSGRFGPEGSITPDFATKVQSGGSFSNQDTSPNRKKKKEDPEDKQRKEDDKFMEGDEGGDSTSWSDAGGGSDMEGS